MNYDKFKCPCCGKCPEIPLELQAKIYDLELLCGPLTLNSGFRCEEHNKKIGGKPNSTHLQGLAADLKSKMKVPIETLRQAAESIGFEGIGVYDNFIHVDIGSDGRRWDERTKNG